MKKRYFLFFTCSLLLAAGLYARGNKDTVPEKQIVRVTGTVRLVGSALFSDIVISAEEGEWYIAPGEKEKLHDFQHQTVTVEGEETVTELRFANGMSAGIRRELSNISLIKKE